MRDDLAPDEKHMLAEKRGHAEEQRADELLDFGLRELEEQKDLPCFHETRSLI